MKSVAFAPVGIAPTVQVPVALEYVPTEGLAPTKAYPDGKTSLIVALAPGSGPKSLTPISKVTLPPVGGAPLLAVSLTARSAVVGIFTFTTTVAGGLSPVQRVTQNCA